MPRSNSNGIPMFDVAEEMAKTIMGFTGARALKAA